MCQVSHFFTIVFKTANKKAIYYLFKHVLDEFNYKDMTLARAKIPVSGQKCKAQLFVYAKPKGRELVRIH
jgi:hypothetical protein